MSCNLLVKNLPATALTGFVVGAFPEGHQFGRLESKSVFISQGGNPNDFPREYVILKVTNADLSDPRIAVFSERVGMSNTPTHRLKPIDSQSPYFSPLLANAYLEVTIEEIHLMTEAYNGD